MLRTKQFVYYWFWLKYWPKSFNFILNKHPYCLLYKWHIKIAYRQSWRLGHFNYRQHSTEFDRTSFDSTENVFKCDVILRKATLVNVKTDIIGCIRTSPTERDVKLKLVIMYVQNFKADVIVFIYKIIMCLTSHYQSQFVENIRQWNQLN